MFIDLDETDIKTLVDCINQKVWSISNMKMMSEENRIHAILHLESIEQKLTKDGWEERKD